jgi:hypothetical protein
MYQHVLHIFKLLTLLKKGRNNGPIIYLSDHTIIDPNLYLAAAAAAQFHSSQRKGVVGNLLCWFLFLHRRRSM